MELMQFHPWNRMRKWILMIRIRCTYLVFIFLFISLYATDVKPHSGLIFSKRVKNLQQQHAAFGMSGSTPNFFGAKLTASTVLQMCFRRIRAVCLEFIAWHLDSIGLFHRTLPLSLLQAGQVFSSSTGIQHTKDV